MSKQKLFLVVSLSSFSALACGGGPAEEELDDSEALFGNCTFTVRGKVKVEHELAPLTTVYGTSPLEGIKIKVSARTWGTWASWGELVTASDGSFSVTKEKSCEDREVRVEVKFQSEDLEVRHEHSTSSLTQVKWYMVSDSGRDHGPGTIDLGDIVFEEGGALALGEFEPRRHADLWVLYELVRKEVASYGSAFAFTGQIKVKYPHNGILGDAEESSYANPITNVVYIYKSETEDHFDIDTLIHELMHIWAYQHSTGEDVLASYLISHGTTHGPVEVSAVAFHEGFAKFASRRLREILFGGGPWFSYNREAWTYGAGDWSGDGVRDQLDTIQDMERHGDVGWYSAFLTMTQPNVERYDYRLPSTGAERPPTWFISDVGAPLLWSCDSPSLELRDVLDVFLSHPSQGHSAVIDDSELTFAGFFDRAEDVLAEVSQADEEAYLSILDPRATAQPKDVFCTPPTPIRVPW